MRLYMATTSLSLGEHWEDFIKNEVNSGRFKTTSEVIRAALRELEERNEKLISLKSHLKIGEEQARLQQFVEPLEVEQIIERAKKPT